MSAEIFEAVVVTGADPLGQGRVRVVIPQVSGDAISTWALPTMRTYGPAPAAGSTVWVSLDTGDASKPVYHAAGLWSPWTPVPAAWMASGWSSANARYRGGPGGHVEIYGNLTTTTSPTTDGGALFNVPPALAPAAGGPNLNVPVLVFPGTASAVSSGVKLTTGGVGTVRGGAIAFTGTLTLSLALTYSIR